MDATRTGGSESNRFAEELSSQNGALSLHRKELNGLSMARIRCSRSTRLGNFSTFACRNSHVNSTQSMSLVAYRLLACAQHWAIWRRNGASKRKQHLRELIGSILRDRGAVRSNLTNKHRPTSNRFSLVGNHDVSQPRTLPLLNFL